MYTSMLPQKPVSKFTELHTVPGVPSPAGEHAELNLPGFLLLEHAACIGCCAKGLEPHLTIHTPSLVSSPYELTPSCQRIIQILQSSRNSLSSLPTFVPIVRETLWSCRLEHCIRYTGNFSSRLNTPLASPPENSAIPIFPSVRSSVSISQGMGSIHLKHLVVQCSRPSLLQ